MKRCLAILMLTVVGLGSVGCVSQTEVDRLGEQVRVRDDQIADLKARIQELYEENEILRDSGQNLGALREALSAAQADLARYQSLLDEARKQIEKLAKQGPALPAMVDQALQRLAAQHASLMTYDSKRGMIRFSSDLTFDLGKTTVKAAAAASLQQLAQIVNTPLAQAYDVRIEGHTDNVPVSNPANKRKYEDNWGLSAFRAIAVQRVLASAGVGSQRFIVSGRGEHHPLTANVGARGTRANRRVEIYLVPRVEEAMSPASEIEETAAEPELAPVHEAPEVFK